jgi:hypothetical protein
MIVVMVDLELGLDIWVPNNPTDVSQIDYEFGVNTKETSFRDLYWNKIYSVSNYISRFQPNNGVENRNITGIKSVDECWW